MQIYVYSFIFYHHSKDTREKKVQESITARIPVLSFYIYILLAPIYLLLDSTNIKLHFNKHN